MDTLSHWQKIDSLVSLKTSDGVLLFSDFDDKSLYEADYELLLQGTDFVLHLFSEGGFSFWLDAGHRFPQSITFEDVLTHSPGKVREILLFHLDLFV